MKSIGIENLLERVFVHELPKGGWIVSLKYFATRETRRGVSAAPFGKRKVFPFTFMKGGCFPSRVPLSMGGHVWQPVGSDQLPVEKVKSGVIIPKEMVDGDTTATFQATAPSVMAKRLLHELSRITGDVLG